MIPVVTLEEVARHCRKRYDHDERRIVGLMLAPYVLYDVRQLVDEQYMIWHGMCGDRFDLFWLGYGLRDGANRVESLEFDAGCFVREMARLAAAGFEYPDGYGIMLLDYYKGNVHYDRSLYYDLDDLAHRRRKRMREFTRKLLAECMRKDCIDELKKRALGLRAKYYAMDISEKVLDKALGIALG